MSKRHPAASRRPTTSVESDDAFVAGVLQVSHWAKANQRTLVIFGVILAAIILVVISFSSQRARQMEQAVVQLEALQNEVFADPIAAKGLLSQYLEQFGNTPYAGEAALQLAQLYLQDDQADLAVRALDRVGIAVTDPLGAQAFGLRARAQETIGDLDGAASSYLAVAEDGLMAFERQGARAEAARIRELQGDWSAAAALYREILDGLDVTSADRGLFEMRLAEAEHRAGG
jgi:predicted negative regulator of RcsB-dependent stress response